MRARGWAAVAWWSLLVIAALTAAVALSSWREALVSGRPVLYGEGAVANAALLLREGSPYAETQGPRFVAANYPPLYLWLSGLGDPFRSGRAVTIGAAILGGALVARRARPADGRIAAALGLSWIASVPVATWGAAVKPDLLAVALTAAAALMLEARRSPAAAGVLLAFAVWAKPTALLPAAALLAWLLIHDRRRAAPFVAGAGAAGALALAATAPLGLEDAWRHVVEWNALPWDAGQALLLVVLAVTAFGISSASALYFGGARGPLLAYGIGGVGVLLLGGREGATLNYTLDLAAATWLALAAVAPRLSLSAAYPLAAIAQLAIATALLAPFGPLPGRESAGGAWGDPQRVAVVRDIPGELLVEDSGLLVAEGRDPVVDDLFLWSSLVRRGLVAPEPLLDHVGGARFDAVVSEVDLSRLDAAPAYERARWHPSLAGAVLDRYRLDRSEAGLWIYVPR